MESGTRITVVVAVSSCASVALRLVFEPNVVTQEGFCILETLYILRGVCTVYIFAYSIAVLSWGAGGQFVASARIYENENASLPRPKERCIKYGWFVEKHYVSHCCQAGS